ncbi:MAG: hypothetical protein ACYCYP_13215 [Leptospirales bacterium]
MINLLSIEERTKFFNTSANLAKTLAFWVVAFSFSIGYLTVWKYLSNNGAVWLFPKIISDYPFQLFMFGFIIVFFVFLVPFFLGVFAGVLTSENSDKRTHISYLIASITVVAIIIFLVSNLLDVYISTEIVAIALLFLGYGLLDEKSPIYSNDKKTITVRTVSSIFSMFVSIVTLPSLNIFHSEASNQEIILEIIVLIIITLFLNFSGIEFGLGCVKSLKNQSNDLILFDATGCKIPKSNVSFFELLIVFVFMSFIYFIVLSNFFNFPRLIITGTGMGGRYYDLELDNRESSQSNSNFQDKSLKNHAKSKNKSVNIPFCIFIQTKNAFYITKNLDKNSKTFCNSYSTGNSVGPLLRIPKKEVISITPE